MRFETGKGLLAVTAAALALAGCSLPSRFQAYPGERIGRQEVMGTWENGDGDTVEFRDDQTFTVTAETFGPGGGQAVEGGVFEGEWELCYYREELEEREAGDAAGAGSCEINSTGHWLTMEAEGVWQGAMVVAFEEDVRLYLYAIGEGVDEADFFTER